MQVSPWPGGGRSRDSRGFGISGLAPDRSCPMRDCRSRPRLSLTGPEGSRAEQWRGDTRRSRTHFGGTAPLYRSDIEDMSDCRLTLEVTGGREQAQPALGPPVDRRVRRHLARSTAMGRDTGQSLHFEACSGNCAIHGPGHVARVTCSDEDTLKFDGTIISTSNVIPSILP